MIGRLLAIVSVSWLILATCAADTRELVAKAKPAIVFLKSSHGSGTGFFVSEDGRIVTNYHVIDQGSDLKATMHDGKELRIEGIWEVDPANDIAILQAPPGKYPFLSLAPSGGLAQGTHIYVLGHPQGLKLTFSDGLVSATRKPEELEGWIPTERLPTKDVIQITAPVSGGSSGSPVMLENGEVVGVASAVIWSGQNLNFAVPVVVIHSVLQEIKPGQKLISLSRAQTVSRRPTKWIEITINLMISFAIFGGIYLGWHYFVVRRA